MQLNNTRGMHEKGSRVCVTLRDAVQHIIINYNLHTRILDQYMSAPSFDLIIPNEGHFLSIQQKRNLSSTWYAYGVAAQITVSEYERNICKKKFIITGTGNPIQYSDPNGSIPAMQETPKGIHYDDKAAAMIVKLSETFAAYIAEEYYAASRYPDTNKPVDQRTTRRLIPRI